MNKNLKVLLIDENKETLSKIKEVLEKDNGIGSVTVSSNGDEALRKIMTLNPDVVVMDLIISGVDGFEVIREAKERRCKSKFIVITSITSEMFVQKAMLLGVDYYMLKPVNEEILQKRINDIFETKSTNDIFEIVTRSSESRALARVGINKAFEEKITNIFISVGIPAHIKGYQFLREAIKMAIETPDVVNSITKKLYPAIAERFSTSASKVERAIRHAIEVAWSRGKIENINTIFGVTVYTNNEKPTNGEFIALVADKMLIEG